MKRCFWIFAAAFLLFAGQATRLAAQAPGGEGHAPEAKAPDKCDAAATKEESSVTDHTIKIGSQTIPYKATAGTTLLKNDKGDPTA